MTTAASPAEAIKAVERLATQDKVDFIMPVYGTGWNLAVAPIFAKYGYPQVTQAAVTDQIDALIARYPTLFFVQGSTSSFAQSAANILKKLKDEGKIGKRVAIVNVADAFGIELANAGRPIFKEAGFDIVYDKSYPNTSQDFAPIIKGAKAENPDAFVAWSYPSDTFGLAEQAKIEGLNVKAYYSAVGVAFPTFRGEIRRVGGERAGRRRHSGQPRHPRLLRAPQEGDGRGRRLLGQPALLHLPAGPGAGDGGRRRGRSGQDHRLPQEPTRSRPSSARSISATRSSTGTGPWASGRTASSTPSPASASPTTSR